MFDNVTVMQLNQQYIALKLSSLVVSPGNIIFLDIKIERITVPFLLFVNCHYTKYGHLGIL